MVVFTFKLTLLFQIERYCFGATTTEQAINFYKLANGTNHYINKQHINDNDDDICVNRKGIFNDRQQYKIAKSNLKFTHLLYGTLSSPLLKNGNVTITKNMIFSPHSIHSAMGMILLGSKNTTAKQILDNVFPGTGNDVHQGLNSILNRFTVGNRSFNLQNVTLLQANHLYVMKGYSLSQNFMNNTK